MSKTTLQKRVPAPLKEKGQYVLAFGVIAAVLYVVGFPFFVIFFLGVLSYFILKMFSSASRIETRRIFEFYLSANEILREDERRWYGFEIQEAIAKGERIAQSMSAVPPLLYFAIGALNHKIGDHAAAVKNLSSVLEEASVQESSIVFPSPELRNYVKLLRRIEREPAEAPLTSAAVRSLERARKNLGKKLLEESRASVASTPSPQIENGEDRSFKEMVKSEDKNEVLERAFIMEASEETATESGFQFIDTRAESKPVKREPSSESLSDRKSISEVLHDIYDKNVQ